MERTVSVREDLHVSAVESIQKVKDWEYLVISVGPRESLATARRRLVEHAEYGRWELQRSILYRGGRRRFWLRRKLMRVQPTLDRV